MTETIDLKEKVIERIRIVCDPEIGLSLYELGLIYDVAVDSNKVHVRMSLTSMACPIGPQLRNEVQIACESVEGIESAEVEVVWDPPWDPRTMASEDAKLDLGIV